MRFDPYPSKSKEPPARWTASINDSPLACCTWQERSPSLRPMSSLRRTLDIVRPHLPKELVSQAAFAKVGTVARHLPAGVTRDIYFECRLAKHASRADLVLGVYDPGGLPVMDVVLCTAPPEGESRSRVSALEEILREWTTPGSTLYKLINHVWLEYDAPRGIARPGDDGTSTTLPSVFLSFRRPFRRANLPLAHVLYAATALGWRAQTDTVSASLRTCFERLPPNVHIEYIGRMLGRPESTLRLCVKGMATDAVTTYLAATTGLDPRATSDVARAASANHAPDRIPRVGMLHLDIDTKHGTLRRIGLERTFVRPCQTQGRLAADDLRFLRRLKTSGLCTDTKLRALTTWPGRSFVIMPHQSRRSVLTRRINHVKFVIAPCGTIEAKAYLYSKFRAQEADSRSVSAKLTSVQDTEGNRPCPHEIR